MFYLYDDIKYMTGINIAKSTSNIINLEFGKIKARFRIKKKFALAGKKI